MQYASLEIGGDNGTIQAVDANNFKIILERPTARVNEIRTL